MKTNSRCQNHEVIQDLQQMVKDYEKIMKLFKENTKK